jgi:hypothetical protein
VPFTASRARCASAPQVRGKPLANGLIGDVHGT